MVGIFSTQHHTANDFLYPLYHILQVSRLCTSVHVANYSPQMKYPFCSFISNCSQNSKYLFSEFLTPSVLRVLIQDSDFRL